jgi:hypothetical protein
MLVEIAVMGLEFALHRGCIAWKPGKYPIGGITVDIPGQVQLEVPVFLMPGIYAVILPCRKDGIARQMP